MQVLTHIQFRSGETIVFDSSPGEGTFSINLETIYGGGIFFIKVEIDKKVVFSARHLRIKGEKE